MQEVFKMRKKDDVDRLSIVATFRVPKELRDAVEMEAKKRGITPSAFVREAIAVALLASS